MTDDIVPEVPAFLAPIPTMIYLSAAASPRDWEAKVNAVEVVVEDALPK